MTTPRPPRSGGVPPRRTPRVAGRTPTRTPQPESDAPTPVRDTGPSQTPAVDTPVVDTPVFEPPPVDEPIAEAVDVQTPAVETPVDVPDADTDADAVGGATGAPRGKTRQPTTKVSTIKPQSTRPSAPAPVAATPAGSESEAGRRPLISRRTTAVVAALAVVVAIVAVIARLEPGVSLSSNTAFVDSAVTSQVTSQANSRICTIFGVRYDKLDEWARTAQSNVTGTAAQRFAEYDKAVRDALTQAGLTSGGVDCRVDSMGVRSIDGDSAVLLANLVLSQTDDQQASGSGTKRYQVSMQRVDGKWLISNFGDF